MKKIIQFSIAGVLCLCLATNSVQAKKKSDEQTERVRTSLKKKSPPPPAQEDTRRTQPTQPSRRDGQTQTGTKPGTSQTGDNVVGADFTTTQNQRNPLTGEQINWQVISTGGAVSTSTNFELGSTLGQLVGDPSSSSNFVLNHGFWQNFETASGSCCVGLRGDVNFDGLPEADIVDLSYLVDFLWQGGADPPCPEEGNIDGSGDNVIDIVDLTFLVDLLWQGGPDPSACP